MVAKLNSIPGVNSRRTWHASQLLQISVVFAFSVAVGMITSIVIPDGGCDMRDDIIPSLYNWKAPWQEGTPLLPWAVFFLMPFRIIPPRTTTLIINFLSVIVTALSIKRLGGNILLTIPVLVSPIGYWLFTTGQTDALVLAGFLLLPRGFDLLFFWKPQVALHGYWVRIRANPKIYLIACTLLFCFSILIWGNWPQEIYTFASKNLLGGWWNRSFWPYSIPIGCYFVYLSIRRRDESYGLIASPLLSPYVNGPSYIGLAAVVAAKWPKLFIFLYCSFWVYYFIRR